MSGIRLKKVAEPSIPPVNEANIYYDIADSNIKAEDENSNLVNLANFSVTGYRLAKVTTITASGTYTPTAGAKALYVECIGGGGAGGGAAITTTGQTSAGAGGAGGGYSAVWLTTVKTSYTVAVGAGGTVGTAGNNPGNTGGDTTFDSPSVCTAKGGSGGTGMAAVSTATVVGGAVGNITGAVGDIKMSGKSSSWSFANGTKSQAGRTFGSYLCGGQSGSGASANGSVGVGYGAGGTGGSNLASQATAKTGGAGAPGLIRVYEFV